MQLIILGMHRSGTSMQTRLLNLAGAYFGPEGSNMDVQQDNPKGFWERRDVHAINNAVLHSVGCNWNRAMDFDLAKVPEDTIAYFKRTASRIVLDMDGYRPWVLKDPRLCLLLPLWRRMLECPVGVHVFRHPAEVASSLQRRNGIPIRVGLALWKLYVSSSINASRSMPAVIGFHQDFVADPYRATCEMIECLQQTGVQGLRLPSLEETEAFVSRELYRERLPQVDLDGCSAAPQIELFEELRHSRVLPESVSLSDEEEQVLRSYESKLPPLQAAPAGKGRTIEELAAELTHVNEAVVRRDTRIGELTSELTHVREAVVRRDTRIGELASELTHVNEAVARRNTRIGELEEKLATATGELRAQLAARIAQLEHERALSAGERDRSARKTQEIARLTRLLISRERQLQERDSLLKAAQRSQADQSTRIHRLSTQLQASTEFHRAQVDALNAEMARMRGSLLWKLGAPARSIKRRIAAVRGIGRPGDIRLVLRSGLFDPAWYLETYRDVAEAGLEPVEHYLLHGADEGRDPGPAFNTVRYLEKYPDVGESGMNPLLHFIRHGRSEGRIPR